MSATKRQFDPAELTLPALGRSGDYRALAALALEGGSGAVDALAELAARGGGRNGGDALAWLWTCLRENPTLWGGPWAWPASVTLADVSVADVLAEAREAASATPDQRATRMAALLPVLAPAEARRRVARAVLSADGTVQHTLRAAAREVLAGSRSRDDRDVLFEDANRLDLPERLIRLNELEPATAREREKVWPALEEVRAASLAGFSVPSLDAARELVSPQQEDRVSAWLTGTWAYEPSRTAILTPALGNVLGADRLASLADGIPASSMLAAASELDSAGRARVIVAVIEAGAQEHEVAQARGTLLQGGRVDTSAWDVAAVSVNDAFAQNLGSACAAGDLSLAALRLRGNERAGTLLAVAAGASRERLAPEDWAKDMVAVHEALGDPFLVAFAERASGTPELPGEVWAAAFASKEVLAAFINHGRGDEAVGRAREDDSDPTYALALLGWQPETASPFQSDLLRAVGWAETGRLDDALEAVNLETVLSELARQVDSHDGPRSERVPGQILTATLRRAVDLGATDELGDRAPKTFDVLLQSADDETVALACEWAGRLAVTSGDEDLVRRVIGADDGRSGTDLAIHGLRDQFAGALGDRAKDDALADPERIACLDLARRANAEIARDAALTLGTGEHADLRMAAATLLAETEGRAADEGRLRELIDVTPHPANLRAQLTAALNALKAPDLGTAITGLADRLGVSVALSEVTAARLDRYPDRTHGLLESFNDVRANSGPDTTTKSFINSGVVLADLLVDWGVLACADTGSQMLGHAQVEAIRGNRSDRMDAGALVRNTQVQQRLPWVDDVLALRRDRSAHPSRPNSTDPIVLGYRERLTAESLLASIVTGWLDTMRDHPPPEA